MTREPKSAASARSGRAVRQEIRAELLWRQAALRRLSSGQFCGQDEFSEVVVSERKQPGVETATFLWPNSRPRGVLLTTCFGQKRPRVILPHPAFREPMSGQLKIKFVCVRVKMGGGGDGFPPMGGLPFKLKGNP